MARRRVIALVGALSAAMAGLAGCATGAQALLSDEKALAHEETVEFNGENYTFVKVEGLYNYVDNVFTGEKAEYAEAISGVSADDFPLVWLSSHGQESCSAVKVEKCDSVDECLHRVADVVCEGEDSCNALGDGLQRLVVEAYDKIDSAADFSVDPYIYIPQCEVDGYGEFAGYFFVGSNAVIYPHDSILDMLVAE